MKGAKKRGRGRGRGSGTDAGSGVGADAGSGVGADAGSGGGADAGSGGGAAAGLGRGPRTSCPAATRRQGMQHNLVGPNALVRMVRPEQVEGVVEYMARSASSSMGLSSSHSTHETAETCTPPPFQSPNVYEPQVMQQSLMLFDDSADLFSRGSAPDPLERECTDAQHLLPVHLEQPEHTVSRASLAMSDDDETQIPTPAGFCEVEAGKEDSGEEWLEDDPRGDDEVLDPTWTAGFEGSEDEEVAPQPQASSSRRGRVQPSSAQHYIPSNVPASTPKVSHKQSPAWHFFQECPEGKTHVKCTLCAQVLKRGKNINNLSTTCMIRHLGTKHELQWQSYMNSLHTSQAPPSAAAGLAAATTSSSTMRKPHVSPRREDVSPSPASAPSPSQSTPSQGSVQISIKQSLDRKRKFGPSHPRTLALNGSISKLLAFEMLPFRLVETDSFRELLASAAPLYVIPSRHYFSRHAVPALHSQVADKIRCALRNAISDKVHITTDTWTSKHGQGRYISLTAHWVNVVAAGPEADRGSAHILPPPRIAGHHSLPPVASSSYSASSSAASSPRQRTTSFSTSRGKRQQAILKLICLGEKPHTAQELWTGIQKETDEWLLPFNLKPGKVVCDNGRNLVAALGRGGLTHIPCLAHVLNLVVQRFLATYPDVPELLHKVRGVCANLRRSHTAAAHLSGLQRRFGLPPHRLICDVATRWNSTLHMVERLCEQQQAIVHFQLETARTSRSADQRHFTTNDWATLRDLCAVLQCFQYATNMVSADDAIVSCTIPILCLLQRTLQAMCEDPMLTQEGAEEEEERQVSGHPRHGLQRGLLAPQRTFTPLSGQGTDFEEEGEEQEEEEVDEEFSTQQGGTRQSARVSLQRGWGDYQEEEEEEDTPLTEESLSQSFGSLPHMSQYMLQCLRRDSRVARVLNCDDYWFATLLDPRYKDTVPSLLPPLEQDRRMRDFKRSLVEALMVEFPSALEGSLGAWAGGNSQHRSRGARSTSDGRVSMAAMWTSMFNSPEHPPPSDAARSTRRQSLSRMVGDYVSTRLHVLQDGSSPFNFWVGKLDTWPELALHALQVLACPAASVLSERVFSTAGGVITDRRIRLSTENVDILSFIKMNQAWIPRDLSIPAPE